LTLALAASSHNAHTRGTSSRITRLHQHSPVATARVRETRTYAVMEEVKSTTRFDLEL